MGKHTFISSTTYRVNIVEVSTLTLIAVGAAWVVTQVITLVAARWLLQNSKIESIQQKDEVVGHFNERLEGVEGHFNEQLEGFEGRFSVAYKEDMETIATEMDKIPQRIKMTAMSDKGAEVRALQAYVDREGTEVEEVVELAEGKFIDENPEMMLKMALKKALDTDVSPKYRRENPIKAMFVDIGKAGAIGKFEEIFLGTSRLPSKRRGNATSPYGL